MQGTQKRPRKAVTRKAVNRRPNLRESERYFRLLVERVIDYAIFMLDPEGNVISWNSGAERIKGYKAKQIIGKHFSIFYAPDDREKGLPANALEIARKEKHFITEGWRVRKDGTFFWASVVIDPIYDDEGRLAGFAKITRDISERRDAQQKLEQMQKQLAESQKMDALGQLTGGVAHDFNNLLMIISGNLDRIRKELSSEKGLKALSAIEMASQRAASLTSQLLTLARRQSVNPQPVDVAQRITSVWEVLSSGIGGAVALQLDINQHVWPVIVDATEFETALVNLVINARDAMPDGGTVTIKAFNDLARKQVAICVIDTGVGIPADVIDKVFEPFFTTKPVGKGTGLGLSQVHGFAHQAGGAVEIESVLGQGTRVCIRLPRSLLVETKERERVSSLGSATILLVEDKGQELAKLTAQPVAEPGAS
jgi:PAS domain S-box-containing protein